MSRSLFSILAAFVTLGGLAAVVWAARLGAHIVPSWTKTLAGGLLLTYSTVLVLRPSGWPVMDLAVLTGAAGGVLLLERGLQTPAAVTVFLVVAAVVDILSVSGGVSRMLIERYREGTSDLLLYLTLVVPIRGRAIPIVGIGDLLVGGAAAAALLRLGFRLVAVMGTFAIGLLTALAYGLWRGGAPAVPFIAAAVFFLVWRHSIRATTRPGTDRADLPEPCRGA
jgi:hypothetical protein